MSVRFWRKSFYPFRAHIERVVTFHNVSDCIVCELNLLNWLFPEKVFEFHLWNQFAPNFSDNLSVKELISQLFIVIKSYRILEDLNPFLTNKLVNLCIRIELFHRFGPRTRSKGWIKKDYCYSKVFFLCNFDFQDLSEKFSHSFKPYMFIDNFPMMISLWKLVSFKFTLKKGPERSQHRLKTSIKLQTLTSLLRFLYDYYVFFFFLIRGILRLFF